MRIAEMRQAGSTFPNGYRFDTIQPFIRNIAAKTQRRTMPRSSACGGCLIFFATPDMKVDA